MGSHVTDDSVLAGVPFQQGAELHVSLLLVPWHPWCAELQDAEAEIRQLHLAMYKAFNQGDLATAAATYSPDVQWISPYCDGYQGIQGEAF